MYIVVKAIENSNFTHFSMLASNGVFVDDDIRKAVIFSTAALATKQKDVLASLDPDGTYSIKQIVLQDVQ